MRRARGFTLVELMVVVALISVIAALAVKAFRKSRTQSDVDYWANAIRNQIAAASKRAVATKQPYLVDVRATSVRWCQVSFTSVNNGPPYVTAQTTCPAAPSGPGGPELGPLITASDDGMAAMYAATADAMLPGASYVAPARQPIMAGTYFFVGKYSTASTQFANVMTPSMALPSAMGFTIYVRRQGTDEPDKRRRVVVYGASAKTRIISNY